MSPKRLRSNSVVSSFSHCCIICGGQAQKYLRKVTTDKLTNLKSWAQTAKNFQLLGYLITKAADAHAGDISYHVQCYLYLRDSASAEERRGSACTDTTVFNSVIIAQIVALVENSDSIFKLSAL